jgi:chaperone modulatory protein CbpM
MGVKTMNEPDYYLTLTEISQCIHLSTQTIISIVDHGIVEPRGEQPQEWLFEPGMLDTLRRAIRLQQDLELDWAAIALALSLIEEVQLLRDDNQRLRQQLACLLETEDPG